MQLFPLTGQPGEDLGDILLVHDIARVDDLEFLAVRGLLGLQLRVRGREALQGPLLVGDPLEASIAVCDHLFLPPRLGVFPLGPCLRGLGRHAVHQPWFGAGCDRTALTVNQCLSRGQREEEDAHSKCLGGIDGRHSSVLIWLVRLNHRVDFWKSTISWRVLFALGGLSGRENGGGKRTKGRDEAGGTS